MAPAATLIQVSTTTERREHATRIADALIDGKIAACVQIVGPITSIYRWNDAVEMAEEWLCLIKTTSRNYSTVERAIRDLHPYDVPEILAVPVIQGSQDYLSWVEKNSSQP